MFKDMGKKQEKGKKEGKEGTRGTCFLVAKKKRAVFQETKKERRDRACGKPVGKEKKKKVFHFPDAVKRKCSQYAEKKTKEGGEDLN